MPMCQCGCVAYKEFAFSPVRVKCCVGFTWAGICRDFSVASCLAYIYENILNSHLDDSISNLYSNIPGEGNNAKGKGIAKD